MTRIRFSRSFTVAVATMTAAMTFGAREALAFPWGFLTFTPRDFACWAAGCPTTAGTIKCADVSGELEAKTVGSMRVTYYCYLPDKSQNRPEDELEM